MTNSNPKPKRKKLQKYDFGGGGERSVKLNCITLIIVCLEIDRFRQHQITVLSSRLCVVNCAKIVA